MPRVPGILHYAGPATDEDSGESIVLPEQDYIVVDTFEPDPSVGIFGEPGVIVEIPDTPDKHAYVSARDHDEYRGIPDPDCEDFS